MNNNKSLLNNVNQYYSRAATSQSQNVVIESGRGAYLYDANGKRYIDLLASASSVNTGHCHPHVVRAIQKQAAKLIQYTPTYFANSTEAKLIPRLAKLAPMSGPVEISWGTSGSAAADSIIKFARGYTHRQYVISYTGACHGSTYGGASASGSLDQIRHIGPLLPGMVKVPYPVPWLRLRGESEDQFIDRMFQEFLLSFKTYVPADETAVIMIEPIQGDNGIVKAPTRYLQQVTKFAHQHGILLAVDEVNQGMGRSGKWWSVQHFPGVEPDLLTSGKSLASGMPLSAIMGRKQIMESLVFPENTSTTAGNPVTAAACSATLDVIENEHLITRSRKLGKVAQKFFTGEQKRYPFIGDVRMYGLNGGIDVINPKTGNFDPQLANKIITSIVKQGVIMSTTNASVLRFQPPLVIKRSTLDTAFDIIDKAFQKVNASL